MKVAITTPGGHVGSAVADCLLDFGGDISVKLVGRRPNTFQRLIQRGAEVAIGSQDDPDFLITATRDVDALFWVTPPGYGSDDVRAFQNRHGNSAAIAIDTNQIPWVVNLSSIGAQFEQGVGVINGLHDVEYLLDEAAMNITHLRPGFFFENLLWQIEPIRSWGRMSLPISGTRRFPMIASRDIGRVAAQLLVSEQWRGHNVRELQGPADLTFDEVAETLSRVLGRKIVYTQSDPHQTRDAIHATGASENFATLMLETYDAIETGRVMTTQDRSAETTTPTTLAEFAREVMLPQLVEAVTHGV
jgi:uncharacterized protein YbjT (DUF2867 family)